MLSLWQKKQFKINFKDYSKEAPSYKSDDSLDKVRYEAVLRGVQEELQRFNLPIHDSENRLIVNNIRELVNNVLKEGNIDEEKE